MDRNYEPRLHALIHDLNTLQPEAAADLLREEFLVAPREASRMIQEAQARANGYADRIGVDGYGNVRVDDERGSFAAGRLLQAAPEYRPEYRQEYAPAPLRIVPILPLPNLLFNFGREHRR